MQNYLVVGNGPFLIQEIIREAAQNKVVIGVDGAAQKLFQLGIKPDIVLGDFDSLEIEYLDALYLPDQNTTDLVKAIRYCDEQGALSITIVCAAFGRLDHHEGALRALRTEYKKNRPIIFHTEQQTICFAKDEEVTIEGEIGESCGVIAYPQGIFSSSGLRYEVDQFQLHFGFSESICNSLAQKKAVIKVQGEALIIKPAQLISQRNYMKKSALERLELQLRDTRLE